MIMILFFSCSAVIVLIHCFNNSCITNFLGVTITSSTFDYFPIFLLLIIFYYIQITLTSSLISPLIIHILPCSFSTSFIPSFLFPFSLSPRSFCLQSLLIFLLISPSLSCVISCLIFRLPHTSRLPPHPYPLPYSPMPQISLPTTPLPTLNLPSPIPIPPLHLPNLVHHSSPLANSC